MIVPKSIWDVYFFGIAVVGSTADATSATFIFVIPIDHNVTVSENFVDYAIVVVGVDGAIVVVAIKIFDVTVHSSIGKLCSWNIILCWMDFVQSKLLHSLELLWELIPVNNNVIICLDNPPDLYASGHIKPLLWRGNTRPMLKSSYWQKVRLNFENHLFIAYMKMNNVLVPS